jgi:hypothetical protein
MIVMELHCPSCHCISGNQITCDWPEPLDARAYFPLICKECGREFSFGVDKDNGMRCWCTPLKTTHLNDFLERRRRRQLKTGQ